MLCPHCGQEMPELEDPEIPNRRLRRNAHDTERDAYFSVLPYAGTQQRRVLDLLVERWPGGATDEEIDTIFGWEQSRSGRPARNGLMRGGWVMDSGERRITVSKRMAIVWKLTHRAAVRLGLRRAVRYKS